jgi:hypothetical protein
VTAANTGEVVHVHYEAQHYRGLRLRTPRAPLPGWTSRCPQQEETPAFIWLDGVGGKAPCEVYTSFSTACSASAPQRTTPAQPPSACHTHGIGFGSWRSHSWLLALRGCGVLTSAQQSIVLQTQSGNLFVVWHQAWKPITQSLMHQNNKLLWMVSSCSHLTDTRRTPQSDAKNRSRSMQEVASKSIDYISFHAACPL